MLKRPKPDGSGSADGTPAPRLLLIGANGTETRETYTGLLRSAGFDSVACPLSSVVSTATANHFGVAVLVGTGQDEGGAIKTVDDMRQSEQQQVRRTAALLLTSSSRNRMFAWETGIDGLVVMPSHLDAIVAEIEAILARPRLSRYEYRQAMVEQARQS